MSSRLGMVLFLVLAGCLDTTSNTDLVDFGPPEIAQVRLDEAFMDASGNPGQRRVFAFGTQPTASADEEHGVNTALATGQDGSPPLMGDNPGGGIRIIMDQLLRGNRLQQVLCRGNVTLDANGNESPWSSVTDDATPDDIAKCCVTDAALQASCNGSNATCVCEIPGGCDGVPQGSAVGIIDYNQDGAADTMRFMPNAVSLACGKDTDRSITVPADLTNSYWNPSGNQLVPAVGGFDAMGPAIVFVPNIDQTQANAGILPTNVNCNLVFDPSVQDKSDLQVCAIPGGRPADCTGRLADCPQFMQGCTPGDVSAFSFGVQAMSIASTVSDGQMDVPLTQPIFLTANVPVDSATVNTTSIQLSPAPTAGPPTFAVSASQITMSPPTGGFDPSTTYTLTISATAGSAITDLFGQTLQAPIVITFTTAAM